MHERSWRQYPRGNLFAHVSTWLLKWPWCFFFTFNKIEELKAAGAYNPVIFTWSFTYIQLSLYIWTYSCIDCLTVWLLPSPGVSPRSRFASFQVSRWVKVKVCVLGAISAISGSRVEPVAPLIPPRPRPRNTNLAALKRLHETHYSYPEVTSISRRVREIWTLWEL